MAFWRTCKHPELLKLYLFELKIQKNPSILLWSLHLASPSSSFLSSFSPSYLHPICLSYLFFPFQSPSSTSSFPPSISNLLFSPLSPPPVVVSLLTCRTRGRNARTRERTRSQTLLSWRTSPARSSDRSVYLPAGAVLLSDQIRFILDKVSTERIYSA